MNKAVQHFSLGPARNASLLYNATPEVNSGCCKGKNHDSPPYNPPSCDCQRKPLKAVLFDLDGTLLNTAPDFIHILNDMRTERHLSPIDVENFKPFISQGSSAMLRFAFNMKESNPDFPKTLEEFYGFYLARMGEHSHYFPGILELLDKLDEQQIKWGVVTNRLERNIPKIMEIFGILSRQSCMVGADTTAHRKPHPAPLIHAAKLLNLPRRNCLYVGDYPTDIQAAKKANMKAVAVTWGYCESIERLEECKPDYLIDTPEKILDILESY
jgi:2-phosphoglycolate phosphatase